MMQFTYAPFAACGLYQMALNSLQPPKPDVRFTVHRVGETEVFTADGYRVTVRVKVKSLKRAGMEKGVAFYDMDCELVPTVAPLLTVEQQEGDVPN